MHRFSYSFLHISYHSIIFTCHMHPVFNQFTKDRGIFLWMAIAVCPNCTVIVSNEDAVPHICIGLFCCKIILLPNIIAACNITLSPSIYQSDSSHTQSASILSIQPVLPTRCLHNQTMPRTRSPDILWPQLPQGSSTRLA